MKWAQLSKHFTGAALELMPAAGFKPREEQQRISVRQLLGRVTGLKRSLAQIVALALVLEFFVLLSPFFMQWVVDDVLVSADRDLLVTLGIGFAMLVAIQAATAAIRSWAVLHLSATLNLQWLGNVFAHLLRLPLSWFERRHMGDIWSRFFAVQQIQKTLTTSFLEVLLDGALVVATLAMMALYSPRLSCDRAGLRRGLCAVALGSVRADAPRHRRSARARRQEDEPLSRVAARRDGDQAVRRRGRSPVAFHESGRRRDERRHRGAAARGHAVGGASRPVRSRARVGDLGRRAARARPGAHGGHAVGVRRLQGAVLAARRRADRQVGRAEDAQGAGRAVGRHRAGRTGEGACASAAARGRR